MGRECDRTHLDHHMPRGQLGRRRREHEGGVELHAHRLLVVLAAVALVTNLPTNRLASVDDTASVEHENARVDRGTIVRIRIQSIAQRFHRHRHDVHQRRVREYEEQFGR